jgi:hypothetical protein
MPDDYRIRKILDFLERDPAKSVPELANLVKSQQVEIGTFVQTSDGSGPEPFSSERAAGKSR